MQERNAIEHSRTQFQIDRIAFFSDAVIAIAITLMILEIRIPALGRNNNLNDIMTNYGENFIIHLAALLICFVTIGNLWVRHHELYEHIHNYNKQLIKVNLYFLFSVMLLPISISFMFTDDEPKILQLLLFFGNLMLCNFLFYLMLVVVFHKKNNFSKLTNPIAIKRMKSLSLMIVLIFISVIILVLLKFKWFYVPFFAVLILNRLHERKLKKILHRKPEIQR